MAGERLHLLVDVADDPQGIGGHQRVDVRFDQCPGVELRVAQLALQRLRRGDVARTGEDAERAARGIREYARVEGHRDAPAEARDERQLVADDALLRERLLHAGLGALGLREILREHRVDELLAAVARDAGRLLVDVGDHPVGRDGEQGVRRGFDERAVVGLLLGELSLQPRLAGDVPRRCEDALHPPVAGAEYGSVERHRRLASLLALQHQLVVGHHALREGLLDSGIGLLGLSEVALERRADQALARVARHAAHLLVDVGDEAFRVHRDQAVHRGLDQAAQVGLLLTQLLLQPDAVGDVPRRGEDPFHRTRGVLEHRGVERHLQQAPRARDQAERVLGHHALVEGLLHAGPRPLLLGEVVGERRADQLLARVAGHLAHAVVDVRDGAGRIDCDEAVHRGLDQAPVVRLLVAQLLLELLLLGDVARRGEHALEVAARIVEGDRVIRHDRLAGILAPRGQLVVRHPLLAQHQADAVLGELRVGEVVLERRADQLLARAAGQRFHLLVHVGDHAQRIGGHQRVHVRFDQRACVELRGLQLALELLLRRDVARRGEDAAHRAARILEYRRVERHRHLGVACRAQRQHVVGDRAFLEGEAHAFLGPLPFGEIRGERGADELVPRPARHAAHGVVDVGDRHLLVHRDQAVDRGLDQAAVVGALLAELGLEPRLVGDVARRSEDAAHASRRVAEHRGVERHQALASALAAQRQLVAGDRALVEREAHTL